MPVPDLGIVDSRRFGSNFKLEASVQADLIHTGRRSNDCEGHPVSQHGQHRRPGVAKGQGQDGSKDGYRMKP